MAAGVGNEAGGRGSEMRGGDYMATGHRHGWLAALGHTCGQAADQ
jgi:hypothetical protein